MLNIRPAANHWQQLARALTGRQWEAIGDDRESVERQKEDDERHFRVFLRGACRIEVADGVVLRVEEERREVIVFIGVMATKGDKVARETCFGARAVSLIWRTCLHSNFWIFEHCQASTSWPGISGALITLSIGVYTCSTALEQTVTHAGTTLFLLACERAVSELL
jgi:hypothetical protein